jgi:uncharacterized protein (DUF1501 family)
MGNNGPVPFTGFSSSGDPNDLFFPQRLAFERVLNAEYDTIYERGYADVQRRAVETIDLVQGALDDPGRQRVTTVFPQSQLGNQLRTVAEMIAARDTLQMERQIFFVATGGFDTHDDQVLLQPGLLGGISDAVAAFYDATIELGVSNAVTTFSMSDFGRTLTSNGDGSDHGWGGHSFVVGDAVAGQDIYGIFPDLSLGSFDDVGGGRMIPTTSADQYAATLSRWFGVDESDMVSVAPNIGNFIQQDLGLFI